MVSNCWVLDESSEAKFIYEFQSFWICWTIHWWICTPAESWFRLNCLDYQPFDLIGEWEEFKTNFGVGLKFPKNNDLEIIQTSKMELSGSC